jgi:hypothetical protein
VKIRADVAIWKERGINWRPIQDLVGKGPVPLATGAKKSKVF